MNKPSAKAEGFLFEALSVSLKARINKKSGVNEANKPYSFRLPTKRITEGNPHPERSLCLRQGEGFCCFNKAKREQPDITQNVSLKVILSP